jgi:hypothetical protein
MVTNPFNKFRYLKHYGNNHIFQYPILQNYYEKMKKGHKINVRNPKPRSILFFVLFHYTNKNYKKNIIRTNYFMTGKLLR